MKKYNKLVRDNIPQIIMRSGKNFKVKILKEEEYKKELIKKVLEEAEELTKATSRTEQIDELADLFELLDYILTSHKIDLLEVQKRRVQKNMDKGGFDDKVFLEYVVEQK